MIRIRNLLLIILVLGISIPVYAHKSEDDKPVHQWIVEQGLKVWPGAGQNISALNEFNTYFDNGNNHPNGQVAIPVGSNANDEDKRLYAESMMGGNDIIEGSQEEDFFCPLIDQYAQFLPNNQGTDLYLPGAEIDITSPDAFGTHFYNPDLSPENGLTAFVPFTGQYSMSVSAREKAKWYFYGGTCTYIICDDNDCTEKSSTYFPGVLGYYNNNQKGLSYYYLGRIAHLLADMSVPAHVHNDPHIPLIDPDAFEIFIGNNYTTYVLDSNFEIPAYYDLDSLFLDIAQITQWVASNDQNGNSNAPQYYSIWNEEWDLSWQIKENITYNEDLINSVANKLMPLSYNYTAALFRFFWETTHPFEKELMQIGEDTVIAGDKILRLKTENNDIYAKVNTNLNISNLEILINGNTIFESGPLPSGTIKDVKYVWQTDNLDSGCYDIMIRAYDNVSAISNFAYTVCLVEDTPEPILGNLISVNEYTNGEQAYPAAALLSNNTVVVVWQCSLRQEIVGAIFDINGQKIKNDFRVNYSSGNYPQYPSVAALDNGGFIVAWHSHYLNSNYIILGQLFDSSGNKIGPTEFAMSDTSHSTYYPKLTGLKNGNFALMMYKPYNTFGPPNYLGYMFTNDGYKSLSPFFEAYVYAGNPDFHDIATYLDGGFTLSWYDLYGSPGYRTLYTQKFNQYGNSSGNPVTIKDNENSSHNTATTILNDGKSISAWNLYIPNLSSSRQVYAQTLDYEGNIYQDLTTIGPLKKGAGYFDIESLSSGGWVTCIDIYEDSIMKLYCQLYNRYNQFLQTSFQITEQNDYSTHWIPVIVGLPDEKFFVIWKSGSQNYDLKGRIIQSFMQLYADSDADSDVDGTDLSAFMISFNSYKGDPNYYSIYDFNKDNKIDKDDLLEVLFSYGKLLP